MKKIEGLYVITDESLINQEEYFDIIESVLATRPNLLQLRIKNSSFDVILDKAKKIKSLTKKYNTLFIVNDYIDIALESDADGVHIGGDDLNYLDVRKKIGDNKIVGVSCYGDLNRCINFSKLGADYIAIGTPYFTKTNPKRIPTSLETMKNIVSKIDKTPIFAIGGIEDSNIDEIISTGVDGIAVINSVFGLPVPSDAAENLKEKLK